MFLLRIELMQAPVTDQWSSMLIPNAPRKSVSRSPIVHPSLKGNDFSNDQALLKLEFLLPWTQLFDHHPVLLLVFPFDFQIRSAAFEEDMKISFLNKEV